MDQIFSFVKGRIRFRLANYSNKWLSRNAKDITSLFEKYDSQESHVPDDELLSHFKSGYFIDAKPIPTSNRFASVYVGKPRAPLTLYDVDSYELTNGVPFATKEYMTRFDYEHLDSGDVFDSLPNDAVEKYRKRFHFLEDSFLEPYRSVDLEECDFTESQRDFIDSRVKHELVTNHIMHHATTALVANMVFRDSNPFQHNLAWYSDTLSKPVLTKRGGNTYETAVDSHAVVRILLLQNASFLWEAYEDIQSEIQLCLQEIVGYTFVNPFARTKLLKAAIAIPRLIAFSQASRAKYCSVSTSSAPGSDRNFSFDHLQYDLGSEKFDQACYDMHRDSFAECMATLAAVGMTETAKLLSSILTADFERKTARIHQFFYAVDTLGGYTRSLSHVAQREQYDFHGEHPTDPPFRTELEERAQTIFEYSRDHKRIFDPDSIEFRRLVFSSLKTTASGGEEVTITYKDPLSGRERDFKSGAKSLNYMMDPEYYQDPANLDGRYTFQNPGVIGGRVVVGGKLTRAIVNVNLVEAVLSFIISDGVNSAVNSSQRDFFNRIATGGYSRYTAGLESGNVVLDHIRGVQSSSSLSIYDIMTDYTLFDASQGYENVGSIYYTKLVELIADAFPNAGKNLSKIYTERIRRWPIFMASSERPRSYDDYYREAGIDFDGKYTEDPLLSQKVAKLNRLLIRDNIRTQFVIMNAMKSGENVTLGVNGDVNTANYECHARLFPEALSLGTFRDRTVQGDDAATGFTSSSKIHYDVEKPILPHHVWTGDAIKIFGDKLSYDTLGHPGTLKFFIRTFILVSKANGLDINDDKQNASRIMYEYIKKRFIFGYHSPLALVQPFSAEKVEQALDPIDQLRALRTKYQTIAFRGAPMRLMNRLLLATAVIRNTLVGYDMVSKRNYTYVRPLGSIVLPYDIGGMGFLADTILFSNADLLIHHLYHNEITFRERFGEWIEYAYHASKSEQVSEMKQQYVSAMTSETAVAEFRDAQHVNPFVNARTELTEVYVSSISPEQRAAYLSAELYLIGSGHMKRLKPLSLPTIPDRLIRRSVSALKDIRELVYQARRLRIGAMMQNTKSKSIPQKLPKDRFGRKTVIVEHSVVEPRSRHAGPLDMLAPDVVDFIRAFGVGTSKDVTLFSPVRLFAPLYQHGFPRDITEDTLFRLLLEVGAFSNERLFDSVLYFLGAHPNAISEIRRVGEKSDSFQRATIAAAGYALSMNDDVLRHIDFSIQAYAYFVDVSQVDSLRASLYGPLAYATSIYKYLTTGKLILHRVQNADKTKVADKQ